MKREYIQLKKYILVNNNSKLEIIDTTRKPDDLIDNYSIKYLCNKNTKKVFEKVKYSTIDSNETICPPEVEEVKYSKYVGQFIATSDNKEELNLFQK